MGWKKQKTHSHGIYASKYKQMIEDLREYAKTPSKFFRDVKGQTMDVANGVTRLVQSIRKRMKLYEDWGFHKLMNHSPVSATTLAMRDVVALSGIFVYPTPSPNDPAGIIRD